MFGYTELNAIVTYPEHTCERYAAKLIAYASLKILIEERVPYLHVASTNAVAIRLYKKLGFATRRNIGFWYFLA
jgi:predicted GNAT family acetyltransferase